MTPKPRCRVLFALFFLFACASLASAQTVKPPDLQALFEKKEVMIPMRDGVKLHTEIYTPRGTHAALPIFMERSPYGVSDPDHGYAPSLHRYS
jgi:uncharacterized protein